MKDRILVVSWFYPPVNTAEAICAYKQLKNSSFEYDIITQTQNFSWSYGNFTSLPELENVNVISIEAGSCKDFISPAVKYFKENIDNYDVVITRSMPPESHEIGLEIKRLKPSIFWIASLNDPIANNPYTLRKIKYPKIVLLQMILLYHDLLFVVLNLQIILCQKSA